MLFFNFFVYTRCNKEGQKLQKLANLKNNSQETAQKSVNYQTIAKKINVIRMDDVTDLNETILYVSEKLHNYFDHLVFS